MKYTPTAEQAKRIAQWKQDLLSTEGPRFNIDYPILEHEGTKPDRFEGDAALFLAYHYADIQDDSELSEFMSTKNSEQLINFYTGIPVADAKQLLEPKILWDYHDYDTSKITAQQFLGVLDVYLETGKVLWEKIVLDAIKGESVVKKLAGNA